MPNLIIRFGTCKVRRLNQALVSYYFKVSFTLKFVLYVA